MNYELKVHEVHGANDPELEGSSFEKELAQPCLFASPQVTVLFWLFISIIFLPTGPCISSATSRATIGCT